MQTLDREVKVEVEKDHLQKDRHQKDHHLKVDLKSRRHIGILNREARDIQEVREDLLLLNMY